MKVLVIGASTNPNRFAFSCMHNLLQHGHEVVAIGKRTGVVDNTIIETELIHYSNIHTVTIYIGKENQAMYDEYLLKLHPNRVIFNPGTHNAELALKLKADGIEVVHDCTLVMLDNQTF